MSHPVGLLLPYLPLSGSVEFADWWLGPLEAYEGHWASSELEDAARLLASTFRDTEGQPLQRPSLLARRSTGVDGALPLSEELEALRLTTGFAAIHQNPYWSKENEHAGWKVATADNADLWAQPLDLEDQWITLGHGSRVQMTKGGRRLGDETFFIPAPLELHLPLGVSLDAELLEALYETLSEPPPDRQGLVERLRVAIRWLLKSWQNTPSIDGADRIVYLKIATEALTGKDKNHESARELVEMFKLAEAQEGEGMGLDDLLWSPGEGTTTRTWTTNGGQVKQEGVTLLEHWAIAFGEARNAIVHGEPEAPISYDLPQSPYVGPFVEVADRVVRELITVLIGECGHPEVWRRGISRASFHVYRDLQSTDGGSST